MTHPTLPAVLRPLAAAAALAALAIVASPSVAAQPPPPGGGAPPAQVPIDGGLGLLAVAGGAYAVRRLRSR